MGLSFYFGTEPSFRATTDTYADCRAQGIPSTPPPFFSEAFACKLVWLTKNPSSSLLADACFFSCVDEIPYPVFWLNHSIILFSLFLSHHVYGSRSFLFNVAFADDVWTCPRRDSRGSGCYPSVIPTNSKTPPVAYPGCLFSEVIS